MSAPDRGGRPGRAVRSPRTTLLVITDGRWDYLERTVVSARQMLPWDDFTHRILVNDSGQNTPAWAMDDFPIILNNPGRLGLAGAIGAGWDLIAAIAEDPTFSDVADVDYVFHLEDDWTFPDPVDLSAMVAHLEADPTLAQVALLRQPVNGEEIASGSLYGPHKGSYTEGDGLVRHRRLFTFNPCVYPRHIVDYGAGLEQEVTDTLLEKGYRFAYLGDLDDPPRCHHIGVRRSAGYRW